MIKQFGEHMLKSRKVVKLSGREVSKAIDVSLTFIYDCERGDKQPSLETAIKLAKLYKDQSLIDEFLKLQDIKGVRVILVD